MSEIAVLLLLYFGWQRFGIRDCLLYVYDDNLLKLMMVYFGCAKNGVVTVVERLHTDVFFL